MRVARSLGVVFFFASVSACSSSSDSTTVPGDPTSTTDGGTTSEGKDATTTSPSNEIVTVTTETVDVDGTAREYVLAVPTKLDAARPYPLVLVFHGDGGSGSKMREYHKLDAVSRDEALVAYPTGINAGWDLQTPSAENQDIKFVESLVAAVSGKYKVDASRVFGTGYSSGAFLVNKIACRKTGFFRGIVSHAGGAPDEEQDPNASQWPTGYTKCAGQTGGVAAMILHGDADNTVTPDSGDFDATYWASLNGCQDTRSDTTPSPCKQHDGCPTGQPVLWCLIPGLSHTVWQNGAKEGWAFMKAL